MERQTKRCYDIRWRDEEWSPEELKKAVEIISAIAFWMENHDPGTPVPDWVYLSTPLDKEELLHCWEQWNREVIIGPDSW